MLSSLDIQLANKKDASSVARLFAGVGRRITRHKIRRLIKEKKVFVVRDKTRIRAAFSYTVFGIAGFFALMYIHKLAVAPEWHGKGLGTFLISYIKSLSLRAGATAFFLFSLKKAKGFYEKNRLSGIGRLFWWRQA